jgi:hypothetical protein
MRSRHWQPAARVRGGTLPTAAGQCAHDVRPQLREWRLARISKKHRAVIFLHAMLVLQRELGLAPERFLQPRIAQRAWVGGRWETIVHLVCPLPARTARALLGYGQGSVVGIRFSGAAVQDGPSRTLVVSPGREREGGGGFGGAGTWASTEEVAVTRIRVEGGRPGPSGAPRVQSTSTSKGSTRERMLWSLRKRGGGGGKDVTAGIRRGASHSAKPFTP